MKKKALVTGATGFIGKYLCSYLEEQGVPVRALIRSDQSLKNFANQSYPWTESVFCDLGKEPISMEIFDEVDTVFHLAGIAHSFRPLKEMEQIYWSVNLYVTEELLKKACQANVRSFIFFSSVKAMADPGEKCVDETWQELPNDTYGLSKREAERKVLEVGKESTMHVCNLRPALVYGPGVKGNILRMIHAIEKGRFPPLGKFENKRSMVSVDDLVQIAVLASKNVNANGKTFIVTDDTLYSTYDMYITICNALEKKIPNWSIPISLFRFAGVLGDFLNKLGGFSIQLNSESVGKLLGSACYKCEKIKTELDYKPKTDFYVALPEMVAKYHSTPN